MISIAIHPNPLIQSLQLAGADWLWTGDALLAFWKTTADTMSLAGWPRFSNPWGFSDLRAAYLIRLGANIATENAHLSTESFRLDACIALWLSEGYEVLSHRDAPKALSSMYLSRADATCLDEESALLWAAALTFEIENIQHPLSADLRAWRNASPNNMRWFHAHQIVNAFKMDLWPTARHMHRLVQNKACCEAVSLDGLLV